MEHNCVRNPDTGACYVCKSPMRLGYLAPSKLEAIVDATQHPQGPAPAPRPHCSCGAFLKASETQCVDCWIAEQTRQPAPKPVKQVKRPVASTNAIDLDSILAATLENNPNKWN